MKIYAFPTAPQALDWDTSLSGAGGALGLSRLNIPLAAQYHTESAQRILVSALSVHIDMSKNPLDTRMVGVL